MSAHEKEKSNAEKPSLEDGTINALEKDFQDVLDELMGDKSLEKYRVEYEKMIRALKKSHDSEKRLMSKCRDLSSEIVSNSAKVETAMKLSQEDKTTIDSLKKEIDKAWKMVDAAHDKETRARETIQSLKLEIANLTKLVEEGAGLSAGSEQSVNELLQIKEDLTTERDDLLDEIVKMRNGITEATLAQHKLEVENEEVKLHITELEQDIQNKSNDASREQRKKEKLDRHLQELKQDMDLKTKENKEMKSQNERYTDEVVKLEALIKDSRISYERVSKEQEILNARFSKLQEDFNRQLVMGEVLVNENAQKLAELKTKEDDINNLKLENQGLVKIKHGITKRLRAAEDRKVEVEGEKEAYKLQVSKLEKETDLYNKQREQEKKAMEDLVRERDILNKNMIKSASATQKQMGLVKLHEQTKKNLEQEISNYKDEALKQRKIIYKLEKERDRYINEASDLTQKVLHHMEEVKVREMQIFDYKKKIAEAETKFKQQQNLYEAVRSDRNLYNKNLIEARDEIIELKRKLKVMNHQIDQLKEEITAKEATLVKEHFEFQRVEKEKEALKAELQRMKQQALDMKSLIETQESEQRKLLKIISDADQERLRQKKELDQVISERDILGTQLVRRNDELALLYEKIKIQQSTLNKGEIQYTTRVEDIRLLKLEIKKLRREKSILLKNVSNVDDLRREVYHIQRELLRERTRCKALEEELENPMNIHRWRKLEGSDPSTYEMVQKIQTLQKRLIHKTEEVVEKELLIQEKEKLYVELKHILARQPGPEVAEQLQIYQQTMKDKTKQLKGMASELNMYESQVSDYKFEIERLAKELQDVKKKYFLQKKKEQAVREKERAEKIATIKPQKVDQSRYAGGGFSLKPPPPKQQAVA